MIKVEVEVSADVCDSLAVMAKECDSTVESFLAEFVVGMSNIYQD